MATWAACMGVRMSLLSMAGIRYEGILCDINTDDSTVVLAKGYALGVCLRGTEGRPADRPIAPREEVFEHIVFRISEIKDLTPCEYMLSALHHDVAMVQSSPGTPGGAAARCHTCGIGAAASCHSAPGTPTGPPRGATGGHPGHARHDAWATAVGHRPFVQPAYGGAAGAAAPTAGAAAACVNATPQQPARKSGTVDRGVQTAPRRRRRWRRAPVKQIAGSSRHGRPQKAQALNLGDEFQAEFDFESSNAQLDREELDKEFQNNKAKQGEDMQRGPSRSSAVFPDKCFYDKTRCFFDNISKDGGRNCRVTLAEEQRLNMQTFGENLPAARNRRFWHSWGHASWLNRRTLWGGDGRPGMPKAGVQSPLPAKVQA
ncbi:protein LSM14 homolog B-like isoform X1 [Petromyzon marinus]|uniref:protein LSM14 homolog B-like isoform X1 n=1 Tax=Petromyzon marinus TaxID=7757 RepID=UPI003F72D608